MKTWVVAVALAVAGGAEALYDGQRSAMWATAGAGSAAAAAGSGSGTGSGSGSGSGPDPAKLPPGSELYGAWVPHPELAGQPQYHGHMPYSYHQMVSVPVAPAPVFVPPPHPAFAPYVASHSIPSVHQCHACYELLLRYLYMRNMIQQQIDRNNGKTVDSGVQGNVFSGLGGADVPKFGQGGRGLSKVMLARQKLELLKHFLKASGQPVNDETIAMMTSQFRDHHNAIQHAGLILQHLNHAARMRMQAGGSGMPTPAVPGPPVDMSGF